MTTFDPDRAALVHDRLNGRIIAWQSDRHAQNYRTWHNDFGDGVIEWDGLLLDGWKGSPEDGAAT